MKKVSYVDSGKVTEDGQMVYNRITGNKGRPARFTKNGTRYVAYKPVKVKATKVAKVAAPAPAPVAPVAPVADPVA